MIQYVICRFAYVIGKLEMHLTRADKRKSITRHIAIINSISIFFFFAVALGDYIHIRGQGNKEESKIALQFAITKLQNSGIAAIFGLLIFIFLNLTVFISWIKHTWIRFMLAMKKLKTTQQGLNEMMRFPHFEFPYLIGKSQYYIILLYVTGILYPPIHLVLPIILILGYYIQRWYIPRVYSDYDLSEIGISNFLYLRMGLILSMVANEINLDGPQCLV